MLPSLLLGLALASAQADLPLAAVPVETAPERAAWRMFSPRPTCVSADASLSDPPHPAAAPLSADRDSQPLDVVPVVGQITTSPSLSGPEVEAATRGAAPPAGDNVLQTIAALAEGKDLPGQDAVVNIQVQSPPATEAKPKAPEKPPEPRERRGLPASQDSPPFPGAEYQGLPLIGVREDTGMQFVMKQLQGTPPGDWLLTHGIKIYGWIDIGANLSTSRNSNFPVAYDNYPNTVYLDQAVFRVQKVIDSAQTDHIDYGFKFDQLYGIDYRYTTMKGVFSQQLLEHNFNQGYDPVQFYGELYIPQIAEGFVLRIGRYVSPPDIEAELALENYLHTHSLTYAYDPYTDMGMLASVRLSPQWIVQAGISGTNDMALWVTGVKPQGFLGARWVAKDNRDSVYACLNSISDGLFTGNHDGLQDAVATWSHRINGRWTTMTEMWYMWQRNAQSAGTENDGPFKTWGGPSGGGPGTFIPGVANELASVNYTEYQVGKWDYVSFRNEVFWDRNGQRTGFATLYTTHTIGWCHYIGQKPDIQFRPEISYDRSYQVPAFDAGLRKNQFLLAADLLIRF